MVLTNILQGLKSYVISQNERSSQSEQAEQYTRDLLGHLEDGKWALLRNQLIFPLRFFVTESFLQSGWEKITCVVGPWRQVGRPVVNVGWFFTSVRVPIQFSRRKLALCLWMTASGKLLTLQLTQHSSLHWKAPPYIGADIQEVAWTLGSGLRRVHAILTLPSGLTSDRKVPCVILIGGSGPLDMDSSVGALKPFKDLAYGLGGRGIAVCRFDKLASTLWGKLTISKTRVTLTDEYVYHVLDAVRQVRRAPGIDADRIVLLGHSLGTLIAARLFSLDTSLAGCILMATPSEPVYRCALRQLQYLKSLDASDETKGTSSTSKVPPSESSHMTMLRQQADMADSPTLDSFTPADKLPFGIGPAYWLEYRTFDPLETLKDVRKPVLFLQGGRDYQTTAEQDYAKFYEKWNGQENFEFHLYENLNHFFMPGRGRPAPLEYDDPANVDVEVIGDINQWITNLSRP